MRDVQELLTRICALDPQAGSALQVIACFDELIVGCVDTRALLSAAASLAGCTAGFHQELPPRTLRITPRGEIVDGPATPSGGPPTTCAITAEGTTVWLERAGPAHPNDRVVIERLALAVRIRHGRGSRNPDNRRELGLLFDATVPVEDRRTAAAGVNLTSGTRYRVIAAPLFASWDHHPTGVEDVIPTAYGPIHALVVPHDHEPVAADPSGTGLAATIDHLHRSFRSAVVALRLCGPPDESSVLADHYGGLIGLLADTPIDTDIPDVDALDEVMTYIWGPTTLRALVRAGSVRQAARLAGVHHSTLHARLRAIAEMIGFDPFDGIGRTRLGMAYLVWRLRNSRVLDLPVPTCGKATVS